MVLRNGIQALPSRAPTVFCHSWSLQTPPLSTGMEHMECGSAHYPPLLHQGAASGANPTRTGPVWMWLELEEKVEALQEDQGQGGQLALGALGMPSFPWDRG